MTPFMVVMAHWIQASPSMSGSNDLMLWADLIGFHHIPGCHDGQHLAATFLHVLDQLDIATRVCGESVGTFLHSHGCRLDG